jgi:voltage-gated potassium channel Kch
LLALVLGVCALGLIILDSSGQPWPAKVSRGLWNALNLITTLGDFSSLDQREKTFMMLTMVFLMAIGGYALRRLSGILSSEAVLALRENKSMEQTLSRITGHVIVIGFGAVGRMVAGQLRKGGEQVVVVDRADDLASQASNLGYLVVQGDAGVDDSVLDSSGIERAKALVVTTEDPDRKLCITLMAHARNPGLRIAVTARSEPRGALLRRAGASDVVIAEDLIAGVLVDCLGRKASA